MQSKTMRLSDDHQDSTTRQLKHNKNPITWHSFSSRTHNKPTLKFAPYATLYPAIHAPTARGPSPVPSLAINQTAHTHNSHTCAAIRSLLGRQLTPKDSGDWKGVSSWHGLRPGRPAARPHKQRPQLRKSSSSSWQKKQLRDGGSQSIGGEWGAQQ